MLIREYHNSYKHSQSPLTSLFCLREMKAYLLKGIKSNNNSLCCTLQKPCETYRRFTKYWEESRSISEFNKLSLICLLAITQMKPVIKLVSTVTVYIPKHVNLLLHKTVTYFWGAEWTFWCHRSRAVGWLRGNRGRWRCTPPLVNDRHK